MKMFGCFIRFAVFVYVIFLTIEKTIPLGFNGVTWLLFLYTCKAFAAQSEIISITRW